MKEDAKNISGPATVPVQTEERRIREAMEAHEGGGAATEVDTDAADEKAKKALNDGLADRMKR